MAPATSAASASLLPSVVPRADRGPSSAHAEVPCETGSRSTPHRPERRASLLPRLTWLVFASQRPCTTPQREKEETTALSGRCGGRQPTERQKVAGPHASRGSSSNEVAVWKRSGNGR